MNLQPIPINSAAWMIGALALFVLSSRLYDSWRHSNNYLSYLLLWEFVILAIGFFLVAMPAFVTDDPGWLRVGYLAGDIFRLGSLIILARIFWFIALKKRISFWWLVVPSSLLVAAAWIDEWLHVHPEMVGNLVIPHFPFWSTFAQVAHLAVFGVGVGLVFLFQAARQLKDHKTLRAASKSFGLGFGFVVVPGSIVAGNLTSPGGETFQTSISMIIGFVVALAAIILVPSQKPLQKKRPKAQPETVGN